MTKENLRQSIIAAALAFPSAPLSLHVFCWNFLQAGRVLFIYLPLRVFAS